MVLPDVITGLSVLLLIIQVQMFPGQRIAAIALPLDRGFFTIFLGHTTLCMAYITVVIRSRLGGIGSILGRSRYGLGCPSAEDFLRDYPAADCPSAIASGFLLGITLLFGRLGHYLLPTSGPGSSTLPRVISPKLNSALTSDERFGNHPDRYHRCSW